MRRFIVQHQTGITGFIGMGLIPLLVCMSFLYTGFSERNITGLLNDPFWKMKFLAVCAIMLAWLVYCLNRIAFSTEKTVRIRSLCTLCALIGAALLLPWNGFGNIISDVHIAVSYAAFVYMNILFYRWCRFFEPERTVYLCLFATAFLISLASGEVRGISEIIYAAGVSVLLTSIVLKTEKAK